MRQKISAPGPSKEATKRRAPSQKLPLTKKAKLITPTDEDLVYDDPMIKYDPADRGCKREGLRVRRHCSAWWDHSKTSGAVAVKYGTLTMKQYNMEKKASSMMLEKHVTSKMMVTNMVDTMLCPKDKLAKCAAIAKDLKKKPKSAPASKAKSQFEKFMDGIKNLKGFENEESRQQYVDNVLNSSCGSFKESKLVH
jgi:hypothetical protein